jgi:hypothetical protein
MEMYEELEMLYPRTLKLGTSFTLQPLYHITEETWWTLQSWSGSNGEKVLHLQVVELVTNHFT